MTAGVEHAPDTVWHLLEDPRVTVHDMYSPVGAPIYADVCAGDRHEVPEIVTALRGTRASVLELAAGDGRLTMPVLAAGHRVTATELSPTMLRLLRDRLDAAPASLRNRCQVLAADMRTVESDRRFDAVLLGTTSVSLLDHEGRIAMLTRVRELLEPGGRFLVTTLDVNAAATPAPQVERVLEGSTGRRYVLAERLSPDGAYREVLLAPWPAGDDSASPFVCRSVVRVLPVETLAREAASVGLRLDDARECSGVEDRYVGHLLVMSHGEAA